jgi:hypothetical protein
MSDKHKWLADLPPAAPPGEWERWDYGKDLRGWSLTCGPMFHADVSATARGLTAFLNMQPIAHGQDLEALKRLAELEIVARVRRMLPVYRIIHARVRASEDARGTVAITVKAEVPAGPHSRPR